jgi:dTDP-4-amino-4,6-dideoxygalactose transaminase
VKKSLSTPTTDFYFQGSFTYQFSALMNIPLLDLKPQLNELRDELATALLEAMDSTRYIMGPEVESLENEVAQYCTVAHGIGVSSGTDALLATLMALDIGHGDYVVTTPFSFFATMGVILRVGATPLFADIDPVTFNCDATQVEAVLAENRDKPIKAIIVVHLFGQCADMHHFRQLGARHNIDVIEDAAQAIGAEFPDTANGTTTWYKAGSLGDAGCFSFFPSKNLGAMGDGGMVVCREESLAHRLRLMRNHGAHPKYFHSLIGGNFRLDAMQAALLRVKFKHLEKWHAMRRQNAQVYNDLFTEAGTELPVITPQAIYQRCDNSATHNYHIYNQYVIRVERRDALRQHLRNNSVASEIYYPLGLHQQQCISHLNTATMPLPHTEKAADGSLALPIYPGLSRTMQEYVVEKIREFYR